MKIESALAVRTIRRKRAASTTVWGVRSQRYCCFATLFALIFILAGQTYSRAQSGGDTELSLTRAARPWEFISALGTRGGLIGNEGGNVEAWVYPLKVLRDFHLKFKVDDQEIDGRLLARSVTVQPESTTITYVWDTFSVKETFFVPVDKPGALIKLDVDATQNIQITAAFERDFQLEWPGAMGGSDIDWVPALHAFSMTENQQRFSSLVGSPSATEFHQEYVTNYTADRENSLGFGVIPPGKASKLIVIAASFEGLPTAEGTYKELASSYDELYAASAAYYQTYLNEHVALELPDAALQQAYEWAQISVLQGLVRNPFLGTGLVAGYKISGDDQRPGYAWFFGRDALWTSLALDAEGDYSTTRTALEFLCKYQRSDGKVTHEIAQGASFVPWFDKMPYAYASADATPLLIIAMSDYLQHSGDNNFVLSKWDNVWRAYQFILSTYGQDGLPRNEGVGHGWVEGGPLLPVRSELYQSALAAEALRSLASISRSLGKKQLATRLSTEFDQAQLLLNKSFWMIERQSYAFAVDNFGKKVDTASVLSAVPMWFSLLDDDKAREMISRLAEPDIQTDWGMRIIPATHPKYDAAGYHSGTVWPLFTGWAAVGEYRYHAAIPAYENLRTNALLTFDGALGHITEVLSGSYYQTLASGSPHQIWSSAMVISPLLTGLFGLDTNALDATVNLSPHVPAMWTSFSINHVRAGSCLLDFKYRRVLDKLTLEVERKEGKSCEVVFSPALSLRAQVTSAQMNGESLRYDIRQTEADQHINVRMNITRPSTILTLQFKDDFEFGTDFNLPTAGGTNKGLRVIDETWSKDKNKLTLAVGSAIGGTYDLDIWNPGQVTSVEGGELFGYGENKAKLRVFFRPQRQTDFAHQDIVIHFVPANHLKRIVDASSKGGQIEQ